MKTKKAVAPQAILPEPMTDLAAIETICAEPIHVDLIVRGKAVRFTGRRLNPRESREIKLILEQVLPPVIRAEGKDPAYDFTDLNYRQKKDSQHAKARAVAIWMAFPIFVEQAKKDIAAASPGVKVKLPEMADDIEKWIGERKLDDDILEELFGALTRGEVGIYEGFISDSSSPKS